MGPHQMQAMAAVWQQGKGAQQPGQVFMGIMAAQHQKKGLALQG